MLKLRLIVLCLGLTLQLTQGAQRVTARSLLQRALHQRRQTLTSEPVTSYSFKRNADALPTTDLDHVMELDRDATLEVVQRTTTVQGTRVVKMQERFKGRVIPDAVLTLEMDHDGSHVIDASGSVYKHIDLDIERSSHLGAKGASTLCKEYNHDVTTDDIISFEKVEDEVLFDENGEPYPAFLVEYLVSPPDGNQRRPTCLIDARDSSIIVSWDAIDTCKDCGAKGIGGNEKIGKIEYGELQRCLELREENGVCYLENKYVRVINNNFTTNTTKEGHRNDIVAKYNCKEINDFVNGGYSSLLDALFYGTVVGKMFEEWYDMSPHGNVITIRVHFGRNISNAFWTGHECGFGDGDGYIFYPLVSVDVMGHEIAHGITEKNSGLYYYQQWGAINEAFSDITGETAQMYMAEADWVMGFEFMVGNTPPVRYLDDPRKDEHSISHIDNYVDFMDPHLGSGVYNHVFYLLVHDYGLPVKEVYHVFLHANRMYWHHMSSYVQAACDVMKSAYDLGQNGSQFRKAFAEVGIEVCDVQDHVLGLKNRKVYTDITVSRAISPTFVFSVPGQFATSATVNSSSSSGDIYIIVSDRRWGQHQHHIQVFAEGLHSVTYVLPQNISTHLTITLTTDSDTPLIDATVVATYKCLNSMPEPHDYPSAILRREWFANCNISEADDNENPDENKSEEKEEEQEDKEKEEKEQDQEQEKKKEEEEKGEEREGGGEVKTMSVSGHVFNFFHSFVIMIVPPSKEQ